MTTERLVERAVYISPDGVTYDLFSGQRIQMSWAGWGMPDINYLSDRGPFQHGRTIRDFRLNQRTFTLQLHEKGACRLDWWCNEGALIDVLRPNRSSSVLPGILRVFRPDDVEIEIGARILRGPAGNWDATGDLLSNSLQETMQFIADDPIWRLPEQIAITAVVEVADSCLPYCVPTCVGGNIINDTFDVKYCGSWNGDVLTITINGPIVSPTITNETTDKQILLNYTAISGETITISIAPNLTTVTNNFGDNLIGTVDNISDLVTFELVGEGDQSSAGINTINFSGSNGIEGETQILLAYFTRHISAFAPCVVCLSYPQTVIDTFVGDLLAYYRFNGNLLDSSRNGHNASGGGIAFTLGGVDSSSMLVGDGANTFVELPSDFLTEADTENLGDQGTIIAWYQPTDISVWVDGIASEFVVFNVDAGNHILIAKLGTGRILFRYRASGVIIDINSDVQTTTALQMFTITWDNIADEVKAYINQNQIGPTETGFGAFVGNFATAFIAAVDAVPSQVIDGFIDEVAIGTRALTATEIAAIYAARGRIG